MDGVAREIEVDFQIFEVAEWEGVGGIYWEDIGACIRVEEPSLDSDQSLGVSGTSKWRGGLAQRRMVWAEGQVAGLGSTHTVTKYRHGVRDSALRILRGIEV